LPENINIQQTLQLLFKDLKVDGLFTDFTDTVVTYLAE
jgi:glycerophosphoryl diester phosphodiesterase